METSNWVTLGRVALQPCSVSLFLPSRSGREAESPRRDLRAIGPENGDFDPESVIAEDGDLGWIEQREFAGGRPLVLTVPSRAKALPPRTLYGRASTLTRSLPMLLLRHAALSQCEPCAAAWAVRRIWDPDRPAAMSSVSLAQSLGCSARTLRDAFRANDLALGSAIRWARLFRGLAWHGVATGDISRLARAMGFSSSSALGHFCERLTGDSPSTVIRTPLGELYHRAREETLKNDRADRPEWPGILELDPRDGGRAAESG